MITLSLLLLLNLSPQAGTADDAALKVEDARFSAMVKGDAAKLDELLDPTLTYHHSTGAAQTKDEFLKAIREGALKYKSIEVVERKVRWMGSVAVITGTFHFQALNNGE